MKKKILKKFVMYVLITIGLYLVVGNLFHRVIFPEQKPDISTYFKPGQEFYCKAEGATQKIHKQEAGLVFANSQFGPFSDGPPKHIHKGFDETFEIENGELTIWVDGEIKKIHPGESLFVPRGTPHKPYNETADTIRMKHTIGFPEKFAFYLLQVYGIMDNDPSFGKSPKTMLQMALIQDAGFDSFLAEGPPVIVQEMAGYVLSPLARLLGYKSYYPEYDIDQK
jgi:mannose-6-phosphate isomerase-like protein (cupin superfamily)